MADSKLSVQHRVPSCAPDITAGVRSRGCRAADPVRHPPVKSRDHSLQIGPQDPVDPTPTGLGEHYAWTLSLVNLTAAPDRRLAAEAFAQAVATGEFNTNLSRGGPVGLKTKSTTLRWLRPPHLVQQL